MWEIIKCMVTLPHGREYQGRYFLVFSCTLDYVLKRNMCFCQLSYAASFILVSDE